MLLDERAVAFYVDVNAMDDDDRVGVTLDSVLPGIDLRDREPDIDDRVWAVDADDNVAEAIVVNKKHHWLQLEIASGWKPLPRPEVRASLAGQDPTEVLRALLRTPPPRD